MLSRRRTHDGSLQVPLLNRAHGRPTQRDTVHMVGLHSEIHPLLAPSAKVAFFVCSTWYYLEDHTALVNPP